MKINRKQKLKDLMRDRTTLEQGLMINQIYCEVFPDIVEEYVNDTRSKKEKLIQLPYESENSLYWQDIHSNEIANEIKWYKPYRPNRKSLDIFYYQKCNYIMQLIKKISKEDDEFRWLSGVPEENKEINSVTGKRVKPYVKYKYVNIKSRKSPELVEQVSERVEKRRKTFERRTENVMRAASLSEEERDVLKRQEIQRRWMRRFKTECTPKHIRAQVTELRKNGKLPKSKKDYRPHIKGIQHTFIKNASEVKAIVAETQISNHIDAHIPTYLNSDDIINGGMLKEIILCDYYKQDYQLPEPKEPDYLGVLGK